MEAHVEVDRRHCVGCGSCLLLAPTLFSFNDDRRAVPPPPPYTPEETARLKEAVNGCPVEAIRHHAGG